jgi:hypothetical protein
VVGQTYPWVVPLKMSHPKFFKPIQNNIGIIENRIFVLNFKLEDYPSQCIKFKTN